MDLTEIHNALPGAQAEVIAARRYYEEREQANEDAFDLHARLEAVKEYLADVKSEFGVPFHDVVVTVCKVDETEGPIGLTLPAGEVRVKIAPHTIKRGAVYGDDGEGTEGFVLSYEFFPAPEEPGQGLLPYHRRPITTESTIGSTEGNEETIQKQSATILIFSGNNSFEKDGARLAAYRETYLPANQARVQNLENSVELIKAAMADPELNPWVEERRQKAQAEAEAAAEAERYKKALPDWVDASAQVDLGASFGLGGLFNRHRP